MSSLEIVFFRSIFGVIVILISFIYISNKTISKRPFALFARGFIGFIALLMFFYNISHMTLAKAIVFSQTSPIFTTIFAFLIFKEALRPTAWIGVLIGFIGILFITQLSFELGKEDYLGILSGVLAGMAYNTVKYLRGHYDSRVIVLSFAIMGSIFPIILMFLHGIIQNEYILNTFDFMLSPFVEPTKIDWAYIVFMGICATLAQILMTKAYGYTKAGIVSSMGYSVIVFSIIVGLFLGEGFPDAMVSMGILFIVASGIIVARK